MKYLVIDCFNFTLIAYAVAKNSGTPIEESLPNVLNSMLRRLKKDFPFHLMYGCWDTFGGTSFRKNINPDYKANRDHTLFDFKQVEAMDYFFDKQGVINIKVPSCEADDAIFILCKILKEQDSKNDITIVSRDKDLIQIVQNGYADRIWDVCKKQLIDIPTYNIVDYKCLVGDKSDGISGVSGIGKKTALQVLCGFKKLTEEQTKIFESCKDIIDTTRHPRFEEIKEYLEKEIVEK